jgi:hypothetical protein
MKRIVVTVGMIALLGGARAVIGQEGKDHGFIQPSEVKWGSLQRPCLPVLKGLSSKAIRRTLDRLRFV